jgi:predicted kinase
MPTVHLICGPAGAGKTTYAIALAERIGGVRLSSEEWFSILFLPDRPAPPRIDWASERLARCEQAMWSIAEQLIVRDLDVVLDLGLSRRDDRDRLRSRVAQTRAESKLHYLDVSRELRRARMIERNRRAAPLSFEVTEAMFDVLEGGFEAPTDDELYGAMILCED